MPYFSGFAVTSGPVSKRAATITFRSALVLGTSLCLFKERLQRAQQGRNKRNKKEEDGDGAPQGTVGGRARLVRDACEGHATGDKGKKKQCCGEDVEIAAHMASSIMKRPLLLRVRRSFPLRAGCR